MKKKLLFVSLPLMAIAFMYSKKNKSSEILSSDLIYENIEALASDTESDRNRVTCYSTYKEPIKDCTPIIITLCGSCLPERCSSYSDKGRCVK